MYQEIGNRVMHHCLATGCYSPTSQAAYYSAALHYATMGYDIDEVVRIAFGQAQPSSLTSSSTVTDKRPFQDIPIYFIMS